MKIGNDSQLPLTALKGALLTNNYRTEFRIHDFFVNLDDATEVMVWIKEYDANGELPDDAVGISWSSIESWTIQLQGGIA